MPAHLLLVLAALAAPGFAHAGFAGPDKKPAPAPAAAGRVEKIDELGLTLTIPEALRIQKPLDETDQVRAGWSGTVGASQFALRLFAMPLAEFGFLEPEDVSELVRDNFREGVDKNFAYAHTELVTGTLGAAPFAALAHGPTHAKDGHTIDGRYCVLGGLAAKDGYALELIAEPDLDQASLEAVLEFFRKGVVYAGPPRNASWTDDEVKARWLKDAPDGLAKKMEKPVRTKHYIFLSNCGQAKNMGEEMEKAYAAIQAMYPFPEIKGRRLMPVFLFTNETQYYEFYARQFRTSVEEASTSKGVAYADFYATYYDAPQDPVHIHEMTHQIFANRLRLDGAGSWFQEGVAEYMSTKPGERTDAANLVKKQRHTKLLDLIATDSLLARGTSDRKKGGEAGSLYSQAALLIEFLRESKWSKDKFLDWVHEVGMCPDNDIESIGAATQDVLGVSLAELETKYVEYCKKR